MPSFKTSKIRRKYSRRKHDHEGLDSTHAPTKQDHDSFESNILDMQSTVGNKAVMQMLRQGTVEQSKKNSSFNPSSFSISSSQNNLTIQRMPTRNQAIREGGLPSGKGGKVTRYLAILTALNNLDDYQQNNTLATDRDGILGQFGRMRDLYDALRDTTQIYIDRLGRFEKNNTRAKYARALLPQIAAEKAKLVPIMLRMLDNPGGIYAIQPNLYTVISYNQKEGSTVNIDKANRTGTAGGGMNEVGFYDEGVFKAPEMHLTDELLSGNDELGAMKYGREEKGMTGTAAQNEYWIAGQDLGLKQTDSLANREVAMSYLDRLLGAGVIVRTEKALEKDGINTKEGVIMDRATGTKMGEYLEANGRAGISENVVMQDLSKLQLLDILALQIDRHTANYMVQTDLNGNITGLMGFDHDMSFGRKGSLVRGSTKEIPGMAKYVDRELAQNIVNLDPAMLSWVLEGLIEPELLQ